MPGGYLRTNFKRTGGRPITDIAGGYPLAAAQGGAGGQKAYGGFVYVKSYSLAVSQAALTANIMGDSTYGILSLFFGAGYYDSGYRFLPLGLIVRSTTETLGERASAWASVPTHWEITFSSSIWMFHCYGLSGTDQSALVTLGGLSFLVDIWGFIVSAP